MHLTERVLRLAIVQPYSLESQAKRSPESFLAEAVALVKTFSYDISYTKMVKCFKVVASTFFSSGKCEELRLALKENECDMLFINHPLTSLQQRNLEKFLAVDVVDRYQVILDIFAANASSYEGRLQVEFAQLRYLRSRLVRQWHHLERQRGGGRFMGGPGERQIELDRRQIDQRLARLNHKLNDVKKRRQLQRRARNRLPYPLIALVGYTNTGKSSLFNLLTSSQLATDDKLFHTLDPTLRLLQLPSGACAFLSDTVGFISDIPTHLIAAFRATLEEVRQADILIHVQNISHTDHQAQQEDVEKVLEELSLPLEQQKISVWNKCDLLAHWPEDETQIYLSARTQQGVTSLLAEIDRYLSKEKQNLEFVIDAAEGAAIAWLYRHSQVKKCHLDKGKMRLQCSLSKQRQQIFLHRFGYNGC